jgi:hypothetical protein
MLGYAHGTIGYLVKKDYKKAEEYLSSGKQIYQSILQDKSINVVDFLMRAEHIFETSGFYFNVLQNEYEMKFIRKKPTVRESNDGQIEIIVSIAHEFVSKNMGKILKQE